MHNVLTLPGMPLLSFYCRPAYVMPARHRALYGQLLTHGMLMYLLLYFHSC